MLTKLKCKMVSNSFVHMMKLEHLFTLHVAKLKGKVEADTIIFITAVLGD